MTRLMKVALVAAATVSATLTVAGPFFILVDIAADARMAA